MDKTTLYAILFLENVFIVLFTILYIKEYRSQHKGLLLFAVSRSLQSVFWFCYAIETESELILFIVRSALTVGIAIECFCLMEVVGKGTAGRFRLLFGLSLASIALDLVAWGSRPFQAAAGNLITGGMLFLAWWHLAISSGRSRLQQLTGWLIFLRGTVIFGGSLLLDLVFQEHKALVAVYLNTIVAAVTILAPLFYLFLLKAEDERIIHQAREEIHSQNQALRQSNNTKDKLFSIIGHDLRGPVGANIGLLELIEESLEEGRLEEAQECLGILKQSNRQSLTLLENLLQWSRVQQGLIPFNAVDLCGRTLIEEVCGLEAGRARRKGIDLAIDCPDALTFRGDRFMLQTVLRNLLANAIKFTPEGGKVQIFAQKGNFGKVLMGVVDSGIGIAPDRIPTLFDIANTTRTTGTQEEGGSGLGLILAKDFVDRHQGVFRVESTLGQGTRFEIALPSLKHSGKPLNGDGVFAPNLQI